MGSNNELKEIDIKNRTCYYIDKIIKIEDLDLDNILIDEKSYENILAYNISYKTLIDAKPLLIKFNKIDGFIRVYDGIRYLVLFGSETYDSIYGILKINIPHPRKYPTSHIPHPIARTSHIPNISHPQHLTFLNKTRSQK